MRWGALVALMVGTTVAGAIGTIASIGAPTFYQNLDRAWWAPPAWLFGPAWTVLYLLMATAAWIVVRVRTWKGAIGPLTLYALQLAANALWTWLFFFWRSGAASFGEIVVLWLLIAATIVAFARVHWLAGVLLLPYLGWVSFAMALTWSVWHRNPLVL